MSSDALLQVRGLPELLARCERRVRSNAVLRGIAEMVCVACAGMLASCLLDFLVGLPSFVRMIFLSGTVLITALIFRKRVLHGLLRCTPKHELGAAVDLRFPALNESLATLISIDAESDSDRDASSGFMRERLQTFVQSQMSAINPSGLVDSRSTLQRCLLAVIAVLCVLLPLFLWSSGSELLFRRFLTPFANLATPTNLWFEVPDADRVVAVGSDVSIVAIPLWRTTQPGRLPETVSVEMRTDSATTEKLRMSFDESTSRYTVGLPDVRNSIDYRIIGGGAATEWFRLKVAERPRILTAELTEIPPVYTGRPVQTRDGIIGNIHVFERSRISIVLTFNKPAASAEIVWSSGTVPNSDSETPEFRGAVQESAAEQSLSGVISADGLSAEFQFDAAVSGRFDFHIRDFDGLSSLTGTDRQLLVTTDTPPRLTVTGISDGMQFGPDDIVPLNCTVEDDIGVATLEMYVRRNSDAERILPAQPMDRGALKVLHEFRFPLSSLDVQPGDEVTFRVRASDDRPAPGPQVVWQGPWTLPVTSSAEPPGRQPLRDEDANLVAALRGVEEQLRTDAETAGTLHEKTQRNWDDRVRDDVRGLSEKQQKQGRELLTLAQQVAEHPLMQSQAEKLSRLASQIRTEIPQHLEEAVDSEPEQATQRMQTSSSELKAAGDTLSGITDEIERLAELEQDLAELNRLALKAEQLAGNASRLQQDHLENRPEEGQSPEEFRQELQERREQLNRDQSRLTDDLTTLLNRRSELLQAARESQLNEAARLASEIQHLARDQQQLSEGIQEEAREAARDVQAIANELQAIRNDTEQLGRRMQQTAQDAARPETSSLDDAVRDLRQGNLATAQHAMEESGRQLRTAAEQLSQDVSPVATKDEQQDMDGPDGIRRESTENATEQNLQRQELEKTAESILARMEELQKEIAEKATSLGARTQGENSETRPSQSVAEARQISQEVLEQLNRVREAAQENSAALNDNSDVSGESKRHAAQALQRSEEAIRHAQAGQFNRAAEQLRQAAAESSESVNQLNSHESLQDQRTQMQQQRDSFNRVADSLQQLQYSNAVHVTTQQQSQQKITEATEALTDPLNELASRLDLPSLGLQHLARSAMSAAAATSSAAESAAQAADDLNQTQLQRAGTAAEESASRLNRAAQLAQETAEGHRDPANPVPRQLGESVTDALQSLSRASELMEQENDRFRTEMDPTTASGQESGNRQSDVDKASNDDSTPGSESASSQASDSSESPSGENNSNQNSSESSEQLASAAKALKNAARGALPKRFTPGELNGPTGTDPGQGSPLTGGNPREFDGTVPDMTRRKGTAGNWGKLQDELSPDVGDGGRDVLDREYSELIRRYRRDLSRSSQ